MTFIPKWEHLRSFSNSSFAKLSILVPVFGYFIIFNDAFITLVGSSVEWACVSSQSAGCSNSGFARIDGDFMLRKMLSIYIALSAIGLSTAIFQGLCPHEIKKFSHSEDYVAWNTKIFHHEFNRRIRSVLDRELRKDTLRIQETFDHYKIHDRPKASEMYDRDILALWFSYQNTRFKAARWICFILAVIGMTLLAYPTVAVFIKICGILLAQ